MNNRTRLQLRLQQTVEGLSVAAISDYIVGLMSYVFKGLQRLGACRLTPATVLAIALVVRRIRKAHRDRH